MRMGLYYRRYHKPKARKRAWIMTLIFILCLMIYITCVLFSRIHSVFAIRADAFANGVATQAVNLATQDYMQTHQLTSNSFSRIYQDEENRPIAVESDTAFMNRFRADITERIAYYVQQNMNGTIYIPLGSLLGNDLFNGVGYHLPVKVVPSDIVDVDFADEFTSVGINQTKHSVYLNARINVSIMTSAMSISEDVYVKFPMVDTVLVGEVPHYYGNALGTLSLPENAKTN